MSVKERLHAAVDAMSEPEAAAALQSLATASGDPVAWMLDHAPSEAPETDEIEALEQFERDSASGATTLSADELKTSLGIE
jgi:hypothetical protein